MISKRTTTLAISLLIGLNIIFLSIAQGATRTFPGCGATLQSCIDAAADGDTIWITAAGVDEDLTISKSLTLTGATKVPTPILGGGLITRYITLEDSPAKDLNVNINQLQFSNAQLLLIGDDLASRDVIIENSSFIGFGFKGSLSVGDGTIRIKNNTFETGGYAVEIQNTGSELGASISSNRMTTSSPATNPGGILVHMGTQAFADIRVLSNVIYNMGKDNGNAIHLNSESTGGNTYMIANNTIDGSGLAGIRVSGNYSTGAIGLTVANNIVSNGDGVGVWLPSINSPALVYVTHDYNNYFNNPLGNQDAVAPAGPNTTYTNPEYTAPLFGVYRLQAGSPMIDSGLATGNHLSTTDAYNQSRVMGFGVERGAVESTYGFSDGFDDGVMDPTYTVVKGTWQEDGKILFSNAYKRGTYLFQPAVNGQSQSVLETTIRVSESFPGMTGKLWVLGWYQDKNNAIELLIQPDANKILLRQRVNGVIVAKEKEFAFINPHVDYRVKLDYHDSVIDFYLDGLLRLSLPVSGSPSGTLGFQVKGAAGMFNNVSLH